MVPYERDIKGIREAALWVFHTLFQVDADGLLQANVDLPQPTPQNQGKMLSGQTAFLQTFIDFEKTLRSKMGDEKSIRPLWTLAREQILPKMPHSYDSIFQTSLETRNQIVHGQATGLSEKFLAALSVELERVRKHIESSTREPAF